MKHLLRFFYILFFILFVCVAQAQTTIAQWNFNSAFSAIPANGTGPAPSTGTGSLKLIGGTTATSAAGTATDPGTPNNALNTTTYPAQGTASCTAGIEVTISTLGFKDIIFSYEQRNSATAANTSCEIEFDGAFTASIAGTNFGYTGTTGTFVINSIDLSGYTNLINNRATVRFRIKTKFPDNSSVYVPTDPLSNYASTGTIRYDLITIKGTPIGCVGAPTQQATDLNFYRSFPTASYYQFNRGNGAGALVVCRAGSAVNANPVDGTNYTANTTFGAGSQIGTGNFVIAKTTATGLYQDFVAGLTPGIRYYYAVYEFSTSGNCFLTPALTGSFTAGSNILSPGDLQFLGWDGSVVSGGTDKYYLLNMVSLNKGTEFSLMNGAYEVGAPANTRTNRWYGNSSTYIDPETINLSYEGNAVLAAGSVISFDYNDGLLTNVKINGTVTTDISFLSGFTPGSMISTTAEEQVFIMQGKLKPFGTLNVDRYNILTGKILAGFSKGANWVNFNATPAVNARIGRVPPEIECTKLFFNGNNTAYAAYKSTAIIAGSVRAVIAAISNVGTNWNIGNGVTTADDVLTSNSNINNGLSLTPSPYGAYEWVEGGTTDWFDCGNWYNYSVPDSSSYAVLASSSSTVNTTINTAGNANAPKYLNKAQANGVWVQIGTLSIAQNDSLAVFDNLDISASNAILKMNNGSGNNKIKFNNAEYLNGSCTEFGTFQYGTNSQFIFNGNRTVKVGNFIVPSLTINNDGGVVVTRYIKILSNLNLNKGLLLPKVLNCVGEPNYVAITNNTVINSPVTNNYGNNKGYDQSFINLPVRLEANATTNTFIPVGKNGIFAPIQMQKSNLNPCVYLVEYEPSTPIDIFNITPNLDHVSQVEYWNISASNFNNVNDAYTQVGLSWRPTSFLSNIPVGNWRDSICVAHYYNPGTGNSWLMERDAPNPPDIVTGNLNYGMVQTNRYVGNFSPFTLGSLSKFIPLPVKLLRFDANKLAAAVQLNWQVAEEKEIKEYVVEKSLDGLQFFKMGTTNAQNSNSLHSYQMLDANPAMGWNYYRLKMVATNNAVTYSRMVRVQFGKNNNIIISPNPTTNFIQVQNANLGSQIQLLTVDGKVLQTKMVQSAVEKIDVHTLAAGMYFIKIVSINDSYVQPFVKQ